MNSPSSDGIRNEALIWLPGNDNLHLTQGGVLEGIWVVATQPSEDYLNCKREDLKKKMNGIKIQEH